MRVKRMKIFSMISTFVSYLLPKIQKNCQKNKTSIVNNLSVVSNSKNLEDLLETIFANIEAYKSKKRMIES